MDIFKDIGLYILIGISLAVMIPFLKYFGLAILGACWGLYEGARHTISSPNPLKWLILIIWLGLTGWSFFHVTAEIYTYGFFEIIFQIIFPMLFWQAGILMACAVAYKIMDEDLQHHYKSDDENTSNRSEE
ncbi:MAG: hypothetical protein COB46_07350 [Rhodospirillaceae bacterium]|nr:MAG: hypothetical protein COB46_07350 [Rhodospirillaceae bacterium]